MDNPKLRMWITYAWADNTQGDFEYLVEELSSVGIAATYDKIAIVPGQRLWEQIAARITKDPIEGWGYLLTANSLASEACREELAYALDRTLSSKGNTFPLIGLLHGVRIEDVPPAFRARKTTTSVLSPTTFTICLASSQWIWWNTFTNCYRSKAQIWGNNVLAFCSANRHAHS
jgi:hypothetical protein